MYLLASAMLFALSKIYCGEVSHEAMLYSMAQDKMIQLQSTNYWHHSNINGCDFECRVAPYQRYFVVIGENLYKGPCDADFAFHLWQRSGSHKQILDMQADTEVFLMAPYDEGCYAILIRATIRH